MSKRKLTKPDFREAMRFAESPAKQGAVEEAKTANPVDPQAKPQKAAPVASEAARSGQIPEGDVRLTANIRKDLHQRLKIHATMSNTTMGEVLEALIDEHLPPYQVR